MLKRMIQVVTALTIVIGAGEVTKAEATIDPTSQHLTREQVKKLTPEQLQQRKAFFQAKIYSHTGGFVVKPGSQKGRIVYVNAQKRAERNWLEESAIYFAENTQVAFDVEDGKFSFPSPKLYGELTVYVIDDLNMPTLMSAPEDRWAVVNVSKLHHEKTPFFKARVMKELSRAVVSIAGGIDSNYPGNCTGPVLAAKDLDGFIDSKLPVDVMSRFNKYFAKLKIKPAYKATYRKACADGWAPKPKDEVQKKIWDEYHTLPTSGIDIKFDPKKGE